MNGKRFHALNSVHFVYGLVLPVLTWLTLAGCAPVGSSTGESQEQATSRNERAGRPDRVAIANDVWPVSVAIFKRLYQASVDRSVTGLGKSVAKHSVTMITNMVSGGIHPVAFYSTVKDFETAGNLDWGGVYGGKGYRGVYTTTNCTSGSCYGLFQVDVNLERNWDDGQFCRTRSSGGSLGLTNLKGGPDFCAAQFWWTVANGGSKCAALNPGGANPCTEAPLKWTLEFIKRGPAAYVQQVHVGWGKDQWAVMYGYYKNILIDLEKKRTSAKIPREEILKLSINRWLVETGMAYGESQTSLHLRDEETEPQNP